MLVAQRRAARTGWAVARFGPRPLVRCFSGSENEEKDSRHSRLKIKKQKKDADGPPKRKALIQEEPLANLEQAQADEYASSSQKNAMFVTKVGAAANLALAISKGTIGYAISSTGLIADAANSLGDLISDAVVYYTVAEARKRATPDRPWGRGKIEPIGSHSLLGMVITPCLTIMRVYY
jgi:hypothetical protein